MKLVIRLFTTLFFLVSSQLVAQQIKFNGDLFIHTTGTQNLFMGNLTGAAITTGTHSTFFGLGSGRITNIGSFNAFFGANTGYSNTLGGFNTFLGSSAGEGNTEGSFNSFVGMQAGSDNTSGNQNAFLGYAAGRYNQTGSKNTFLGYSAGPNNTTGSNNIIIGPNSGTTITTSDDNVLMGYNVQSGDGSGSHNVIIGGEAGGGHWAGGSNTLIGHQASAESVALHHATAIGADARVTSSNAVVLGNQANVGIGTSAPTARLEIVSESTDASGLRLTNLTSHSKSIEATDQFLSVNEKGDVIKARYQLRINNPGEWSDKVFSPDYQLRSLASVATYISQYKHLPNVPSTEQVVKEGVDLLKMNATLLEKVEELTLYSIQQMKELDQLKKLVKQLLEKK